MTVGETPYLPSDSNAGDPRTTFGEVKHQSREKSYFEVEHRRAIISEFILGKKIGLFLIRRKEWQE